jgi:hypothetical protein
MGQHTRTYLRIPRVRDGVYLGAVLRGAIAAVYCIAYLRATSVPEGQEVKPFSPSELAEVRRKFSGVITFKDQ